jgi:caa(3)-type oxidase subunit IV
VGDPFCFPLLDMKEESFFPDKRTAFLVYAWLVGLTLLEVGMVLLKLPKYAGVILMAGTTVGKMLMIALHFMHMKNDRAVAWLLPGIPVVLAVFFIGMLFPDLVYHLPLMFH